VAQGEVIPADPHRRGTAPAPVAEAADTASRHRQFAWGGLRQTALAALGLAGFLLIWEALPRLGLFNAMLLPVPSAIPSAFWSEVKSGAWLSSVRASLGHYTIGLLGGSALGLVLGVATGMSRIAEDLTSWVVRVLRPIPGLAWVPFAIIWFGVSTSAAVFIIAIGVFWIVFFAAHGAVRGVDRDLIEVADAFGFRSAHERLFKILLPAALPGILVGVRTALGQAWMAVVAAEIFGVPGLGQRMIQASSLLATELVVVYMLTMAALYGLLDTAFVALQNWLLRWKA
jgi:sulfonate transport system permease protein